MTREKNDEKMKSERHKCQKCGGGRTIGVERWGWGEEDREKGREAMTEGGRELRIEKLDRQMRGSPRKPEAEKPSEPGPLPK